MSGRERIMQNGSPDWPTWLSAIGKILAGIAGAVGATMLIRKARERARLRRVRRIVFIRRALEEMQLRVDRLEFRSDHSRELCERQVRQFTEAIKGQDESLRQVRDEISQTRSDILDAVLARGNPGGGEHIGTEGEGSAS